MEIKINTTFVRIHECKTPPGRHRNRWNLVLKGMGREDSCALEQGPLTETYQITTPWSRFHPEELTVPQIVKKFTTFYGTRRFITAFTIARNLSLS